MINKQWYQSKTVWGILATTIFTLANHASPSTTLQVGQVLGTALAAYGYRDAL